MVTEVQLIMIKPKNTMKTKSMIMMTRTSTVITQNDDVDNNDDDDNNML